MERRLVAILATDLVGYSQLMQADEVGTVSALNSRRRQVLEPLVNRHGGRIVKLMGDGALVEFASAVNAVACGVELQDAMAAANADLPESHRLVFRVGINIGDVVVEDDDLFGDGVNVASRLEALAEPGAVYVSHAVYSQVRGRVSVAFEDIGERKLKNMVEPVRVYRVAGPSRAQGLECSEEAKPAETRISIAILPFANMSDASEQQYFADGLTEDLIMAFAKLRHLRVVPRNIIFQYKNRTGTVQQVGRELGVRYAVEGSVRRSANRVRVTAQLIDCSSGNHLWAERFDRELTDVFAVQDEIVRAIRAQLKYSLIDAAVTIQRATPATSITAYDYFLRARFAWRKGDVFETRDCLLKAVAADPGYAAPLASLAFFFAEDIYLQVSGQPIAELGRLAHDYIARALAANDGDPFVHGMLGSALIALGRHAEAKRQLDCALSLDPLDADALMELGMVIGLAGQHDEGLAMIDRVLHLEPRLPPSLRGNAFWIRCAMGDPDGALAALQTLDEVMAAHQLTLAICFAGVGRSEEAENHFKSFQANRSPWFDAAGFTHWFCKVLALPADRERFLIGARALDLLAPS
jgi:adenylate cyclase